MLVVLRPDLRGGQMPSGSHELIHNFPLIPLNDRAERTMNEKTRVCGGVDAEQNYTSGQSILHLLRHQLRATQTLSLMRGAGARFRLCTLWSTQLAVIDSVQMQFSYYSIPARTPPRARHSGQAQIGLWLETFHNEAVVRCLAGVHWPMCLAPRPADPKNQIPGMK